MATPWVGTHRGSAAAGGVEGPSLKQGVGGGLGNGSLATTMIGHGETLAFPGLSRRGHALLPSAGDSLTLWRRNDDAAVPSAHRCHQMPSAKLSEHVRTFILRNRRGTPVGLAR
eukprot:gene17826-biopygen2361